MDDEVKGKGNSVNYKYRMHDPRVGRFFAIDPLSAEYPWNSPYAFSENKVIAWQELEGLESYYAATGEYLGCNGSSQEIKIVNDRKVWDRFESARSLSVNKPEALYTKLAASASLHYNSKTAFREEKAWDVVVNWGLDNIPKSHMFEYGAALFEQTLIDKDGNSFVAVMIGSTETNESTAGVGVVLSSSLVIGSYPISGYWHKNGGLEFDSPSGWERRVMLHTHPPRMGKLGQKFSEGDYGQYLDIDVDGIMFSYDSKSLFKFNVGEYKQKTTKKFEPLRMIGLGNSYTKSSFDQKALEDSTYEYSDAIKTTK